MFYSAKRQQFLIDQGYSFKVITRLGDVAGLGGGLCYGTKQEQLDLLKQVLGAGEEDGDEETLVEDIDDITGLTGRPRRKKNSMPVARRTTGNMGATSGGNSMVYMEYKKPSIFDRTPVRHSLFKKRLGK